AAGNVGIEATGLIWVILFGSFVSLITMFAGYFWAIKFTKDLPVELADMEETFEDYKASFKSIPTPLEAFGPILIPIILMTLGSLANFPVVRYLMDRKN